MCPRCSHSLRLGQRILKANQIASSRVSKVSKISPVAVVDVTSYSRRQHLVCTAQAKSQIPSDAVMEC